MANRGGFTRGPKMRKHWHGFGTITERDVTANSTFILAQQGFIDTFTVLRFVGELLVVPTGGGTFAAADAARVTVGLGIVTTDAATVGSSAMPDPADEPDFDWLWWYSTLVAWEDPTTPGQELGGTSRVPIASKAMRKMKPNMSVVILGQYVDVGGTPPVSVHANGRFLVGE